MGAARKSTTKSRIKDLRPKKVAGPSSEAVRGGATTSKVWDYIKSNKLQDQANKR